MRGGTKSLFSLVALISVASGALLSNTAVAADLGGDCCADLEERIAELEATTARKGNRKVSLSISGFVTQQVMWWDDGEESNVYVNSTAPDLATRFTFGGTAQIAPGVKAGYQLTLSVDDADSLLSDQDNDNAGTGVTILHSNWYFESEKYGTIRVGRLSHASDNAAIDSDLSGTIFPANTVTFDGSFFRLRASGSNQLSGATWWDLGFFCQSEQLGIGGDCAGDRRNAIRYDTPSFGGLTLSASWGRDDFWDVAARWKGEFQDFQLAISGAYTSSSDDAFAEATYAQVGGFIKHNPSGLWVHGIYGNEDVGVPNRSGGNHYYLKAGLTKRLNSLGNTHFYGEYGQNRDMFSLTRGSGELCGAFFGAGGNISDACANDTDTDVNITSSEATRYGIGVVQDIDAAAMQLWAKWRLHELTVDFDDNGTAGSEDFDDLNMFIAGAAIFF